MSTQNRQMSNAKQTKNKLEIKICKIRTFPHLILNKNGPTLY